MQRLPLPWRPGSGPGANLILHTLLCSLRTHSRLHHPPLHCHQPLLSSSFPRLCHPLSVFLSSTTCPMSRFSFALALIAALFSFVAAETIVTDSVGNGVSLPTTGGNATNFITVLNSQKSTSPYHLYVSVNDGQGPNDAITGEIESFYVNTPGVGIVNSAALLFGNATLLSQQYSSSFAKDAGVTDNFLRNQSNPNTAAGTYTFVFDIPALSTLTFNLTYVQSGSNPLPIVEVIEITIFNPASSITGDPQFVGLRGQSYQVHGIDGAVYSIISESNTQVNSRFVFLTEGQCPVVNGERATNCWSHPGSYLGEISFQAVVDGKLHAALLQSGSASKGFAGVQVDGKSLSVGDKVEFGSFSVQMLSAYNVAVTTESFAFDLSNSDMFINQALRARVPLSQLTAHGLIGQTHSLKTHSSSLKYIEGEVDDYTIQDGDIFGTDFVYNKFQL